MTARRDTCEIIAHAAAAHGCSYECSSHVTGLSAVRAVIGRARSVIEQVTVAEARSFMDRSVIAIAGASRRRRVEQGSILLGHYGA